MLETQAKPALYLIDGSNYLYRAFYAIQGLSNSKGFPTNAIFGFTNMLMKLLRERKPDYVAITFDVKGPTFRHEAFDAYKATRRAMPDALIPQIPFIKDIVRGFAIPVLERQGVEADDIIGTIARRCAVHPIQTVIVSGDKDLMQLVSQDVTMWDSMTDKTYDETAVRERFGVPPGQVVEILGLMGDTSDNIPGVPGIGPKGALRLIEAFGTVEGILMNTAKVHNAKLREALEKHADQARMSRQLAVIQTDVDIDFDLEGCRYRGPQAEILLPLFKEFEFSSLLQELKIREETEATSYRLIRTRQDFDDLLKGLAGKDPISLEVVLTSGEPMRADILGIAIGLPVREACYIPLAPQEGSVDALDARAILERLAPLLTAEDIGKWGHDLKNALIALSRRGIPLRGLAGDTMVAAYLLNPARGAHSLSEVSMTHLNRQIPEVKELTGSGARMIPLGQVPADRIAPFACSRADAILTLSSVLQEKLQDGQFRDLFKGVEMPLITVLAAMEEKGVLLDLALLDAQSQEMGQLMARSEEDIYRLAGERFNVNSPKQLQTILFDKLGLPKGRKTKEGYSTDSEVLAALAMSYELPGQILAYRSLAKLKSTYIDALPALVNPSTGRIHTSYNQTVTATGRLSSSNPNLQNIPIRTMEGKRIRQAFIAPPGWEIVSADYSQIELRVLAHLSGDEALTEAFNAGEDIHTRTASDIFGVFPEMVNADMRRQAKVINFGVLYGMSAFGLSRELNIPQKTAQAYIDGYFKRYGQVRAYLDGILDQARREGYVTTILNRRRYIPEINHPNGTVRQFAERTAINAPLQGSAADLIKMAMLKIARVLSERHLDAAMIMQVHDELVCEVPQAETKTVMELVRQEMEGVMELRVPLKVDVAAGLNWDEAH